MYKILHYREPYEENEVQKWIPWIVTCHVLWGLGEDIKMVIFGLLFVVFKILNSFSIIIFSKYNTE